MGNFRMTNRNIKKYIGIPYACPELILENNCIWKVYGGASWMDHFLLEKDEKDIVKLISEPYHVSKKDMGNILKLCNDYKLEVQFCGYAKHNSGCVRIELWNPNIDKNEVVTYKCPLKKPKCDRHENCDKCVVEWNEDTDEMCKKLGEVGPKVI